MKAADGHAGGFFRGGSGTGPRPRCDRDEWDAGRGFAMVQVRAAGSSDRLMIAAAAVGSAAGRFWPSLSW